MLSAMGCAGPPIRIDPEIFSRDTQAAVFYSELDGVIQKYGVSDASSFSIAGFPYMRTNRFLSAIKDQPDWIQRANHWVQQMLDLGLDSRQKEIANLPAAAVQELAQIIKEPLNRQLIIQKAEDYAYQLLQSDQSHPDFLDMLQKSVQIPDEYSTLARWLGLYPLAGIPVTAGTAVAYNRYEKWHDTEPSKLEILGALTQYIPPRDNESADSDIIKQSYNPNYLDALGLPKLTSQDEYQLALRFAPIIRQDVVENYDRIGRIAWQNNLVKVDSAHPSVYYYISHSFLDGHPVLQINYAFWYSERAGKNAPWIERGPLDGITYRVTLDPTGDVAMLDVMNSCGCYFFFVPKKESVAKIINKPGEIAPLVPTWMPSQFPQKRLLLSINSGWHQVQGIMTDEDAPIMQSYTLIPYSLLESLPREDGQNESVFTPAGIMKDSWRIEPYIFFSMGIEKIGYMRQRGHHAIKMVGRGHFSDPNLYDSSFQFH